MAFRRRRDSTNGTVFKFEKPGDNLTGFYLGSKEFESEFGVAKKHLFQTDKGLFVVLGQSNLTAQLLDEDDSPKGKLCRITFLEERKSKKGRNMVKVYQVEVDDEQVIAEDKLLSAVEAESNPSEYADNSDDDIGDDSPEEEDNELAVDEIKTAPARNLAAKIASPAANASKARLQELIKKRPVAS